MRIAAISDIHGNLHALEAVLADIARRGVDATVNLGDLVSGPLFPRETADRLMALGLPTLAGNHERQVLTQPAERMSASDRYAAAALSDAQRAWMAGLPMTLQFSPEVFLCHATPSSDVDVYLEDIIDGELVPSPLAAIEARTGDCTASLIFCGHTHVQRVVRLSSGQLIVNPGSVGSQAYHGHHPIPHTVQVGSPHARYAIAERSSNGWVVELLSIPYPWDDAAAAAARHGRAEWVEPLRTGFIH